MLFSVVPIQILKGNECPAKGYECSHGAFGYYDSKSDINDLMKDYGIDDPKWKDKNGAATYSYGDGHKTMVPHPEYAAPTMQLFY
mmetsp:Transcript_89668/g.239633  ORF Transcript_89668/g.239633 Transcript_89668/m.239633 type:complete len:85 (-) Transcript_89668:312-566(-)